MPEEDVAHNEIKNDLKEKYPMYLCVDMPLFLYDSAHHKMVYTYVEGKRTKCMTEYEFRSKFRTCRIIPRPPSPGDATLTQGSGRNLSGVDYSDKDMMKVNFQAANLQDANFSRCDMRGANLRHADCRRASFEGAFMKNVDLRNADMTDARLRCAYFVNADLTGARGLTLENIRFVETLHACRLDPDILALVEEYCPAKFRDLSFNWGRPKGEDGTRYQTQTIRR
jgi:hypothetical protein